MPAAGYDIGASNANAANVDPFTEAATNFIFGSEDNPSTSATQSATSDATATTKSPGATTVTGDPGSPATSSFSTLASSITLPVAILVAAVLGVVAIFILHRKS